MSEHFLWSFYLFISKWFHLGLIFHPPLLLVNDRYIVVLRSGGPTTLICGVDVFCVFLNRTPAYLHIKKSLAAYQSVLVYVVSM